jgi:hypothetical protein
MGILYPGIKKHKPKAPAYFHLMLKKFFPPHRLLSNRYRVFFTQG